MTSPPAVRMSIWLLPIVLVVCALMILPGGAIFGAASAHPASSGGASALGAASSAGPSLPTAGPAGTGSLSANPFSGHSNPASTSSGILGLNSAKSPLQYANDLRQIGSNPNVHIGTALDGLAAAISSGKVSPSSAYLPNLNLLESGGAKSPSQQVGSGYESNPAPMGIGDLGLGTASPYVYNTSHFEGTLTLNAANATYPGAYYFMGSADGGYTSPYNFGIQLNTVTSNISAGGVNDSSYWTQNVVTLNGNTIGFEDNVWNFSSVSGLLLPGSIANGNGIYVEPSFYYDYGPQFPLTFPVTVDLYNNVTINTTAGPWDNMDQVTFGYRVVDSMGTWQGVYDTVVFNNPYAPSLAPPDHPAFTVSGKYVTPLGLNYESELIFGGPGGGSNAVFGNINGTEQLLYSNVSSGGWKHVPSAYDWGSDTGETAIGVGETYTNAGVVDLQTGPSVLYGLWNSETQVQASPGSLTFSGTLAPDYGFVFAGDGGPYANQSYVPTTVGGAFDFYLPPVNTQIPFFGVWYLFGLADGYDRYTSVGFTTSQVGLTITLSSDLTSLTAPLYLTGNAQAQAAATHLESWSSGPLLFPNLDLLNASAANPSDPWFFDHLNDWGFVTFNMFQAVGVTDTINVTDAYQGNSDYGVDNIYFFDGAALGTPPSLLGAGSQASSNLPQYGGLVAFYDDSSVKVYGQTSVGYFAGDNLDPSGYYNLNPAGGAVVLYADPSVNVSYFDATTGSYGVWAVDSNNLEFYDGAGLTGANALSLIGSNDANVYDVVGASSLEWTNHANGGNPVAQTPFGVYDVASSGGTFNEISGIEGGVGFAGFGSDGANILNVEAALPSTNVTGSGGYGVGVTLTGALDTTITNLVSYEYSIGVTDGFYGPGSFGTTITNLSAIGIGPDAIGFELLGSEYTNVTNLYADGAFYGGIMEGTGNTTFVNSSFFETDYGVVALFVSNTTFDQTNVGIVLDGVIVAYAYATTFDNLNVTGPVLDSSVNYAGVFLESATDTTLTDIVGYGNVAVYLQSGSVVNVDNVLGTYGIFDFAVFLTNGTTATVNDVNGTDESGGVAFLYFNDTTTTNVLASYGGVGLVFEGSSDGAASTVSVWDEAVGVGIDDSTGISVTGVTVSTADSVGVEVEDSTQISVSTVSVSDGQATGVVFDESSYSSASGITAANESFGVFSYDSEWISVSDVTVTYMSVGVFGYESYWTSISGVTASNATTSSPWTVGELTTEGYAVPGVAAVVTEYDQIDSISGVTATNYPAAYYDIESYDAGVTNVNATGGWAGLILNESYYGVFTNIGAFQDFVGIVMSSDTYDIVVTQSAFVDCTSYGVAIYSGEESMVYLNNFIGNNGATGTYNAAHIQAFSTDSDNYWDGSEIGDYQGNYWSDWHTYNSAGDLAPYPLGSFVWDYYPLGGPEGTIGVWFYEDGLASGVTWSVTFNGVTQSTANDVLVFYALPGSYAFSAAAVSGYMVAPGSGTVTVAGSYVEEYLTYTPIYNVTVTESGLPANSAWSVTVGGTTLSGSTSALSTPLGPGNYTFQVSPIAGYSASPASGTFTVVNADYNLVVTFTQVTYAVTVTENGLGSGTSWTASAVSGGTTVQTLSSSGTSMTFNLPNGTYSIVVKNVSGYSLSGGTLPLVVSGSPAGLSVSFSPNTTTSLVSTDTFNTWLAVAIAVAVVALLIGLLALLFRRRKENPPSQGAQPWNPPAQGATTGASAGSESGNWSEGPPAGGSSPPS